MTRTFFWEAGNTMKTTLLFFNLKNIIGSPRFHLLLLHLRLYSVHIKMIISSNIY